MSHRDIAFKLQYEATEDPQFWRQVAQRQRRRKETEVKLLTERSQDALRLVSVLMLDR